MFTKFGNLGYLCYLGVNSNSGPSWRYTLYSHVDPFTTTGFVYGYLLGTGTVL